MGEENTADLNRSAEAATAGAAVYRVSRHKVKPKTATSLPPVDVRRRPAYPRHYNYWIIPTGVVSTIALWTASAMRIGGDRGGPVTVTDLALVGGACVASLMTVLWIKDYARHQANASDHDMLFHELRNVQGQIENLRSQLVEVRAQVISRTAELRTEVAGQGKDAKAIQWQAYEAGVRDILEGTNGAPVSGGEILRFPQHRDPRDRGHRDPRDRER